MKIFGTLDEENPLQFPEQSRFFRFDDNHTCTLSLKEPPEKTSHDWKKDLPTGEAFEVEMQMILRKFGYRIVEDGRKDNKYDFSYTTLSGTKLKAECKFDERSATSGNVAIEYEGSGKASGIHATEADYYFIKLFDEKWVVYQFPVNVLRFLIQSHLYKANTRGGDCNNKMYLFDVATIKKYGAMIF